MMGNVVVHIIFLHIV